MRNKYPICGIYMIVNQITGQRYIGQSIDIERRFVEHKCPSAINGGDARKLHEDMRIYGSDNFYCLVLKECDEDELNGYEVKFISMYSPEYNTRKGGSGRARTSDSLIGRKLTDETKNKIRLARTGSVRSTLSIARQKETMREKKESGWVKECKASRVPIVCTTTGEVFESVTAAGVCYGIRKSDISHVLRGDQKKTHNLHFEYERSATWKN